MKTRVFGRDVILSRYHLRYGSTLQTLDLIFERISLQHTYPHTIPKVKEGIYHAVKKNLENNPNAPNKNPHSIHISLNAALFFVLVNVVSQRVLVNTAEAAAQERWVQWRAGFFHLSIRFIQPSDSPKGTKGDLNTLAPFEWGPLGRSRGDTAEASGH